MTRKSTFPGFLSAIRPFFLNSVIILLSAVVYHLVCASSWEFMPLNILGLILGVIGGLFWSAVMMVPFLITSSIVSKRHLSPFQVNAWLCGPSSVLLGLFFLASAVWISLPVQRLNKFSNAHIDGATNIHAAGITSFLAGDWIATCDVDETTFRSYCLDQGLVAEETINVMDRLKNCCLIRSAKIITELPDFKVPLSFSKLEGDNQRQGVFTLYDRDSSTMVIYRYFHD